MAHPIVSLLTRHKMGHSLDQAFYTSQDVFDADMENIFYKEWLFAIPACEIPIAGDYVGHDIGAYRVIIVRDSARVIRAFHNSCRHRGSLLCEAAKGNAAKLVCPYHSWTYELDGKLLWARDMGEDFDAADYGLKPIHCETVAGLVYICLADEAPEFASFADTVAPYLAPHNLDNA